ncbi:ABC transporter ATP-binding protein [Methylobacterium sp. J-076]|uniref:ABC transporter ATP-binding protein n=1 Tax=Methylobacterium sp. J-076 TaxID=2836655 RepID=UPI001FBB2A9B|nr:ABC transporter ATP-binding protein [Methylobacterium sp. J-076]MCJ2012745.1 ABC transporter ATP-binding protein/permease [Methylobacterium sp. J-076]
MPRPSPTRRLLHEAVDQAARAFRHLPALAALSWRASRPLTIATVGLRLVRALIPVASLYLAKLILDGVVGLRTGLPAGGVSPDWSADPHVRHIGLLVAGEFGLAILSDLLTRATTYADAVLADRTGNAITLRLMTHAATLDLAQFEDSAVQDRLERARRQVMWRSNLVAQVLGRAQDLVTVLSLAGGVVAFAPSLVLLLVAALVPAFLNELHFNRHGYRLAFTRTADRRESDYLRYLGAGVESAKEVKLFNLSFHLTERFRTLSERMVAENAVLAARRGLWGGLFAALGTTAYYAAYALILWRTMTGALSVGDLTFLSGAFLRLRGLVEGLLLGVSQISGQAQYLDDLFGFFAIAPSMRPPEAPVPMPRPIAQGFVFEDVGFRYPDGAGWAVRHLDLTIRAGEVVALVGENGAGKTTLVKLLTRLYDPSEGRILLDGVDLRAYAVEDLRARVGVIFQDFLRLDFTAGDNIAAGRIEASGDGARIEAAAGKSLADAVIARLPGRYAQQLGRRFEDGIDLSGGEWQKIAIARAYMRDAEVLILDEPTAALDARSEYEVFRRFGDLAQGRTAVLISHRFSTVRMADRIVVIEGGRVLETGSHETLLALSGRYAELFALQAAGYR